ncbi:MAG TPA: MFS transporter [Ignavibacteria bacterium]|nr:MFS transporter [Ignavibacteria bacterium]
MDKLLNEYVKPTKTHYKILFLSWAGWVFDFYDLILFTFLMIPLKAELGLSDIQVSFVLGSSLAATAVGGVIFGYLSDKFGRKPVLQWTIVTYSIGTFLSGFSNGLLPLLIFRIITGLGVGGEWATGQTFIGETFPAKMRGRYGAFMQTGAPLGIALATIIGGYLAPVIGWRECFYISILPAILVIFMRRHLPESDIWEVNKNLKPDVKENKFLLLFNKDNRRMFVLALVLAIFDMSAYWFTYSWMPGYLHQQRQFTLAKSALFMLVTQSGGFIGYTTFGFMADKYGRRPAYTVYSVIMAAGLIMITTLWNVIEVNHSFIYLCMFLVGFGTGMFGGYGPLFSEIFPTEIRSTAMGTAFNLARGIQFVTPVVISLVAVNYGLGGGISIAAIFALLTGLWIWMFPETRGKVIKR